MCCVHIRVDYMITITTSNLNGIRAAERKGMLDWSDAHTPDVWCMQEVRAPQVQSTQL